MAVTIRPNLEKMKAIRQVMDRSGPEGAREFLSGDQKQPEESPDGAETASSELHRWDVDHVRAVMEAGDEEDSFLPSKWMAPKDKHAKDNGNSSLASRVGAPLVALALVATAYYFSSHREDYCIPAPNRPGELCSENGLPPTAPNAKLYWHPR